MRIRSKRMLFNHHPFDGQGFSLYVNIDNGNGVTYRNQRIATGNFIKGTTGIHDIAATNVQKSARVASASYSTADVAYALPAALASQDIIFDVRHFKDNVENNTTNFRTQTATLDSNRDEVTAIHGTATLLEVTPQVGGVVKIRFAYQPVNFGTQPTQFVLARTAGPTSPSDVTVSYGGGRVVTITTSALSDSSTYTFKVTAKNGSTTKDVLTGISVDADATGPVVPTGGSISAV